MDHITFDRFNELANMREPHSISIFIPTHRAGMQVNEMVDQKHLKNQIKKVREDLRDLQIKEREIDKILLPAEKLLEDTGFWSLQSEGLAIFIHPDLFEYYTLPVSFEPFTYIADHFYLKPLIPYLNDDGRFYLLALSLNEVKVFEGFPHHLSPLALQELLPERLEEIVGYDYKQKNLQFRTGHSDSGQAIFHGHGAANEQDKKEMIKFFRAVNDGLMDFLYDKHYPLIIAAVDYLVPIYKQTNDYKHLHEVFIAGNPEHEKPVQLHQKAKAILAEPFSKKRKEKISAFDQALSNNRATIKEEDVVTAALNQRVDTLFVRKGEELWGVYEQETNQVNVRQGGPPNNVCLINMAAVHTLLNRGTVYLLDASDMPDPNSKLTAILRY